MTDDATITKPQTPAAGALVQVKQNETLSPQQTEKIRQQNGRNYDPVHWIYARVLEPIGKTLRVKIEHPGNRQDGQELIVPASETRGENELASALAEAEKKHAARPSQHTRDQVEHFSTQLSKVQAAAPEKADEKSEEDEEASAT